MNQKLTDKQEKKKQRRERLQQRIKNKGIKQQDSLKQSWQTWASMFSDQDTAMVDESVDWQYSY